MHRVRHSLPYFKALGWDVEVIAIDPIYIESYNIDPLLEKTIPQDIPVHHVKAWPAKFTRKIGLGSLSLRSLVFYRKKGNELLRNKKFDLVYFSTTAFHLMVLGRYWKKKFRVPYVLDFQDPWRNDFYLSKPKQERPPKFRIAYTIDKFMERYALPKADGIISVSQAYCDTFIERYPGLKQVPCKVVTFGGSTIDVEVMEQNIHSVPGIQFDASKLNIVYIGCGGLNFGFAVRVFFSTLQMGLAKQPQLFSKVHSWFIGTSYVPKGQGRPTIRPFATEYGVEDRVTEMPERISFFETLFLLKKSTLLFMPGTMDTSYTASKLYPYILANKPLLSVFSEKSSVVDIIRETNCGLVEPFAVDDHVEEHTQSCYQKLVELLEHGDAYPKTDWTVFEKYTAAARTKEQTDLFDEVLARHTT